METDAGEPIAGSSEFKLLQAYCSRRRKKKSKRRSAFTDSPVTAMGMSNTFLLQSSGNQGIALKTTGSRDELGNVADKLTQIADNVDVDANVLESDSSDDPDDVIQKLVSLLRLAGDELDGELKKNPALLKQIQSSLTYGLFEKVTKTFLGYVLPLCGGPTQGSQQAQIAVTCEVTSRLSALDLQPMNRVMGFGAQFLQQNFSGWVQHHGGWVSGQS
ncbi:hypothetical protein ACEWY4_010375 [Coilia grayii]|uniref:Apoptosis facilitator Bcl-2-like protein 14 n=1 Tax=Coilia grayii TaxID=363190 RepID=A0ABD1K2C4_9TELE